MIAKLIVWDRDRDNALRRMRTALTEYRIAGLSTNIEFLSTLCANSAFQRAELDTGFIEKHRTELFPDKGELPSDVLAMAALYELLQEQAEAHRMQAASNDPGSPWGLSNGWRMNQDNYHSVEIRVDEKPYRVVAHYRNTHYLLELPTGDCQCRGEIDANGELLTDLDGRRIKATVLRQGQDITLIHQGRVWQLQIHDPRQNALESEGQGGDLSAPMPGAVIAIKVAAGDVVKKGDALIVVEAMKMEHTITAPADGTIREIRFAVGDQVEEGDPLLSLET